MSKTLIIGASGNIGKLATELMLSDSQPVVALVRDKSKLEDLNSPHLEIVEADLEGEFGFAFENCEKVIFTAGSGGNTDGDKTLLIDLWAAVKAINYAKQHQVKHFTMISSIGSDTPDAGPAALRPYLVAKHMADEHLVNSGIDYTILRPAALTDDRGSGLFRTDRPQESAQQVIARENVAQAIKYVTGNDSLKGQTIELFDGNQELSNLLQ